MGWYEGYRKESDKYIYFYQKKNGSCEPYVFEVIDKSTGNLLPFYIKDNLRKINWDDDCNFEFNYALGEINEEDRSINYKEVYTLAYDVLKDYLMNKMYNCYEVNCYGKYGFLLDYDKFLINVMKECGGFKDKTEENLTEDLLINSIKCTISIRGCIPIVEKGKKYSSYRKFKLYREEDVIRIIDDELNKYPDYLNKELIKKEVLKDKLIKLVDPNNGLTLEEVDKINKEYEESISRKPKDLPF